MSARGSSGRYRSWGYLFKRARRSSSWGRGSAKTTSATSGGPVGWSPAFGGRPPNPTLQQTPAAMRVSERSLSLSAAAAAELCRSATKEDTSMKGKRALLGTLLLGVVVIIFFARPADSQLPAEKKDAEKKPSAPRGKETDRVIDTVRTYKT